MRDGVRGDVVTAFHEPGRGWRPTTAWVTRQTILGGILVSSTLWSAPPPPEARFIDAQDQWISAATSGVELARLPPTRLPANPLQGPYEATSFRVVVSGSKETMDDVTSVDVRAWNARGKPLDILSRAPLWTVPCASEAPATLICRTTFPLRAVVDEIDRLHPVAVDRSIQAELGGALVAAVAGRDVTGVRVVGVRTSSVGPIERLRARLRVFLVRDRPKGAPPFGRNDAQALELARDQIAQANRLWGQCGISFDFPEQVEMKIVDPPAGHMVAVGCDLGLPASGGVMQVTVDGVAHKTRVQPGDSPRVAARRLARVLEASGLRAHVSENMRIGGGAYATSDVLIRRADGSRARVEAPEKGPLSSDATLSACIGAVDLTDGLQHFFDSDAIAGTVEERALLKALEDGDPRTIEVVFVPAFATGGRIGESFIRGDRSSLSNMLIEDRAGVRADQISFALAHELGHVLLDVQGHTDDFGADTPMRLMDRDAADPSPFGPRRLSPEECDRAVRQSGPGAPSPLLQPWPLTMLPWWGRGANLLPRTFGVSADGATSKPPKSMR